MFDRDRLRLLACGALHRLSNITQVDEPDAGAVPHNRLTHSLSVAAVGRSIALGIGAEAMVVETGCLAHDLGHPPFGHNGEQALRITARTHGLGFEANAQTRRILTHLDPSPDPSHTAGLNLTRAGLDAACKYPWTPGTHRKFGAYPEDTDTLAWIRDAAPDRRLCVEAQIMDVADDITDLTAGMRSGAITLAPLTSAAECGEFAKLAHGHFTSVPIDEIDRHTGDPLHIPAIAALTTSSDVPDTAAIGGLGHTLTARFATAVVSSMHAAAGPGPHHRFTTDLIVPDRVRAEIAVLKALHLHFVLRAPELRARRAWQRHVIDTVFDGLLTRAPDMLEPRFAAWWNCADTDTARVRVILDQVAAYTDRRMIEVFGELTGDRVPGCGPVVTGGTPPVRSPGWPRPRAS